jgi:hypothetical protein
MAMTRVEIALTDAFVSRSSMSKVELMEVAGALESPPLLSEGYRSLMAKGVLLEDDWGVVSINRQRAQQVLDQVQLYEPLYGEE